MKDNSAFDMAVKRFLVALQKGDLIDPLWEEIAEEDELDVIAMTEALLEASEIMSRDASGAG